MKFFTYTKKRSFWILVSFFILLALWNTLSNSLFLETCNSPINSVEDKVCGNMSPWYGSGGRFLDSAADVLLVPTILLDIAVAKFTPLHQFSNFDFLSLTVINSTTFSTIEHRDIDVAVDILFLILECVYLFFLSALFHSIWTKSAVYTKSKRTAIRAFLIVLILYWATPAWFVLPHLFFFLCLIFLLLLWPVLNSDIH